MPRRVLISRDNESFDLIEVAAPDEHSLQEVVKASPQLIPADDLGLDGDLLVVGRETALASGYIDLLCLSRSGEIVLVEFKTGPQNPDFRHALAQLIDYGSDLWQLSLDDFDRGVVQRYLAGNHVDSLFKGARTLVDAIARTPWRLAEDELERTLARVEEVLRTGDFIYVVAAQRFTEAMTRSLEYVNVQMRNGRFYLVEVIRLAGAELTAHAAQIVAAPPSRASARATSGSAVQADEAAFLAGLDDDLYRSAVQRLIAQCESLGIEVKWRDKGASLRIQTPDRRQPLSIGWLLPEGSHWQGTRFVTLGVDPTSLQETPSVAPAVLRYVERVESIPGGRPVGNKVKASIFEPRIFPMAFDAASDALESLVSELFRSA